ncbi:MAG: T9SS type A sorting domain-containing protein, partial [Rhodothermales bacterium]|nr:T9SS type A sorting domain-containing protein [Rhodothermales bacterium]
MKSSLLPLILLAFIAGTGIERASAQQSLTFTSFALEPGSPGADLQVGAIYRFSGVAAGVDALVEIEALSGGATLVQIDDPNPSTEQLQPTLNGAPDQTPQADFSIRFVAAGTSTPGAVSGLELGAVDVDGSAGRQEYVILSGVESYTVEGLAATSPQGPSELTISADPLGTRILGPETTYTGIDPTITQVIAVADVGSTSRIDMSIGQTGTITTAGDRLFSWEFRVNQIVFDDPVTTNLTALIGAALAVGTITDNGNGSYNIPMTFLLEGFGDVPLQDVQVTDNLAASFGTYVSSGPLVAGQYTVDDPVIGTLTGGALLSAGNSSFDGSTDQNLLALTSGDRLPVGSTAEITFNVTWYPPNGVTSTTNQGTGRGDFAEDGTSDGSTTDTSHSGSDPDPESDGPADNSTATSIDVSGLPVEMASFEVVRSGRDASIRWSTYSESNNAGFDVEHRSPEADGFVPAGFVAGAGYSTDINRYEYRISELAVGTHAFRLRQVDYDGTFAYSEAIEIDVELAERFELGRAYPNPFNPTTSIRFALREAGSVDLTVYDVTGKLVQTLAAGFHAAGTYDVRFEAADLPSGLYVYRLMTESGSASAPVVLL